MNRHLQAQSAELRKLIPRSLLYLDAHDGVPVISRLRQRKKAIQRQIDKINGKRNRIFLLQSIEGTNWFASSCDRVRVPPTLNETVPDWGGASSMARAFLTTELTLEES